MGSHRGEGAAARRRPRDDRDVRGSAWVGSNVEKLVDLGDGIAASGGPPTPEQGAEIQRLGAAIEKASKIDLLLLFLAVACMATARYW